MKRPSPQHKWYVYKYVDPRPEEAGVVIYIGKGTHTGVGAYLKRMHTHWQASEHRNHLFRRVLTKIDSLGLVPEISVVSWHDTERAALDAEIENIAIYGLRRNGGTLCNLTLGGEGTEGYIHTPEEIAQIAEMSKANWQRPTYRAKRSESLSKYISANPEEIANRSAMAAASWTDDKKAKHAEGVKARGPVFGEKVSASLLANPEFRRKASENAKRALQDPEVIARRKVTLKTTMADPAFRAELSRRTKMALANPGAKANQQAAALKMWSNPEYRETALARLGKPMSEESKTKQSASLKTSIANMNPDTKVKLSQFRSQMASERHAKNRAEKASMTICQTVPDKEAVSLENRSAASIAMWQNPEYREKRSRAVKTTSGTPEAKAKKSAVGVKRWEDPEFKARNSAAIRAAVTTPEHRAKVSEINKALWVDPAKRAAQLEKMKSVLADPAARARKAEAMRVMWAKRKALLDQT